MCSLGERKAPSPFVLGRVANLLPRDGGALVVPKDLSVSSHRAFVEALTLFAGGAVNLI